MIYPNIANLKLIQIEDIQLVIDSFVSLNIYESLNQKGETATLVFRDYLFIEDSLPILGGETVKIVIEDQNKETVKYEFIVAQKVDSKSLDKMKQSQVTLYLIDKDYFNIQTTSYPYGISSTLTASAALKKILNDKRGITFKTKLNLQKPDTNILYNFYSPLHWSYDNLIDYILSLYENSNECGFFFFKDKVLNSKTYENQYVVKSTKDILKEKIDLDKFTFNLHYKENFNYIQEFKLLQSGPKITNQINSENLFFKSYSLNRNKQLSVKTHDYSKYNKKYENSLTKVSKKTNKYSEANYKNFRYIPEDYSSSEIQLNNMMALDHLNQTSAEITIQGRFNLKLGSRIYIQYNRESGDKNENLNGFWIVYHINNSIDNNITFVQHVFILKVQMKSQIPERIVNGK